MSVPAADRLTWATEERERRTAAQRLARAARRNCGSRDAARAKFQALRTLMADLFQTYAEQEYARGQASPTALQHSSASEAFSLAPSLTAVLSGDFEHTSVARDKKLKRLCGGVWKAARSQSNPEAAARDLVAKCLLCVDGANEWPPTAPPPLPPPPNMRFALQPPDLQGINGAELTGLKGTVVEVLRHSTNDRLVERAMARDEKQSRSWHPPRPLVRHKKKHKGYGQFASDSEEEDDDSDSDDESGGGSGDDAASARGSKEGSRVGSKAGSRVSAGASSSSASSSSASSSSASSSSSSTRDPRAGVFRVPMDPRKYDPSLAHHASRLTVLRPRHLRERFDRPDVDFSHSVVGTSALVAAAQFEDIPDKKESLPPLAGAEPPPPGSAAALRQSENDRRTHCGGGRHRRRSRRGSRLSQGSSRGSSRGSRSHSGSDDSSRSGSRSSGSYSGSSSSDGSDGHSSVDSVARSEDDLAKSGPMVAVPGHRGIRRGGRSVAAALIAMGAEVNEVAVDGVAALHAAAQQGNLETLARLLEAGAHRGVRDKYGRRADQVILEELPKEKHAAALLLLRDRPQPPPPARLLDSTPRSATLTWEAAATFPGEYPLTHHRATLRITAPPATSAQYTHCVASLFIDLVEANQAPDGVLLRKAVTAGKAPKIYKLPFKLPRPPSLAPEEEEDDDGDDQSFGMSEPTPPLESAASLGARRPGTGGAALRHRNPLRQAANQQEGGGVRGLASHRSQDSATSSARGGASARRGSAGGDGVNNVSGRQSSRVSSAAASECGNSLIPGQEDQDSIHNNGQEERPIIDGPDAGCVLVDGAPPLTVRGLIPFTTYGVQIAAESLAGCSVPTLETFFCTKGEVPTTPSCTFQVGMTRNSITIMWIPPEYDNGSAVETYEVRCFQPVKPELPADKNEKDSPIKPSKKSRNDQFFPHLGPSLRYRVVGEENYMQVKFREYDPRAQFVVRARNSFGWSPFSKLSPVLSGGDSIRVVEVAGTYLKIEWDCPPGMKIDKFEVQSRPYKLVLQEDQYVTLKDAIPPSSDGTAIRFAVRNLKPGSKHQLRARSADNNGWRPWKTALVSEVLQCTSDVPGAPTVPKADLRYTGGIAPDSSSSSSDSADHFEGGHNDTTTAAADASSGNNDDIRGGLPASNSSGDEGGVEKGYNGSHDDGSSVQSLHSTESVVALPSIATSWLPGPANGCPIEEHEIWGRTGLGHEPESGWRLLCNTPGTQFVMARGLMLGSAYEFRTRSRNRLGWSAWSQPSPAVTVFRVLPPAPPHALKEEDEQDDNNGEEVKAADHEGSLKSNSGPLSSGSSSRRRRNSSKNTIKSSSGAAVVAAARRDSSRGGRSSATAAGAGVTFLRLGWAPPPGVPPSEVDSYALEYLEQKESSSSSSASSSSSIPQSSGQENGTNLWRSVQDLGGPGLVQGAGRAHPTLVVGVLLPGHTYAFRVKALCFAGWTDWSQPSKELKTFRRF